MDYREGGGREASGGQNGDDGRLHRSETRRSGNVVRQTQKRHRGTRIAAECAKDAGANAAKSRAATIRSASSFREEFMCGPASMIPRGMTDHETRWSVPPFSVDTSQ
jgi:hypothetical protein